MPLGDAMLDRRTRRRRAGDHLYRSRLWLAHQAGADSRALLGRAIAHELGHLLLATTTHGPVGLMRALWSQDEVRRGFALDWAFAPTEIAAMRRRAEGRQTRTSSRSWGTLNERRATIIAPHLVNYALKGARS